MQTYELIVKGRAVHANCADTTLVRTSIGIDKIHVLFDNSEWLAFSLSVTFAQGSGTSERKVTTSITPATISGSEWVAEAECLIPYEVIEMVGEIRVTFQGYDTDGNHIITAKGAPLYVEEAGDVNDGLVPSSAPSLSEWEQAYADAMAAASAALSAANAAQEAITAMQAALPIASTTTLGGVKVDGTTITATAEGVISGVEQYELPAATAQSLGGVMPDDDTLEVDEFGIVSLSDDINSAVANLRRLASGAFDTTFDSSGALSAATVKSAALPAPTQSARGGVVPDGTTLKETNGILSASIASSNAFGIVKADGGTTFVSNGLVSAPLNRATSSTGASTAAKLAYLSITGFSLVSGAVIPVTFSNANSVEGAITLNVNSTGAKNVYVNNAITSSSNSLTWTAGETLTFMYDGTQYRLLARDKAASGGGSISSSDINSPLEISNNKLGIDMSTLASSLTNSWGSITESNGKLDVDWTAINGYWYDIFNEAYHTGLYHEQQGDSGIGVSVPYMAWQLAGIDSVDWVNNTEVHSLTSYGLTYHWDGGGDIWDTDGWNAADDACLAVNVDNSTIKINANGQLYVDTAVVAAAISGSTARVAQNILEVDGATVSNGVLETSGGGVSNNILDFG